MSINPSDLKAYTKFVEARGKRKDMDADFVRARIDRLAALIEDGSRRKNPPAKMEMWAREFDDLQAVALVMASIDEGDKTNG